MEKKGKGRYMDDFNGHITPRILVADKLLGHREWYLLIFICPVLIGPSGRIFPMEHLLNQIHLDGNRRKPVLIGVVY